MNPVKEFVHLDLQKRHDYQEQLFSNLRERCYSKPLLSDSEYDDENSGSVLSVIDAMKSGQDIYVTINDEIHSLSVDNIECNEMEDEVAAMDIWQITSFRAGHYRQFSVSIFTVKFILV